MSDEQQWQEFFERVKAIPNGERMSNDEFVTKLREILRMLPTPQPKQ